jgi:phosphoenolpyruvate carboxylase
MLNLANLAEEVQIAYRRRSKLKSGGFADEGDIEETLKRASSSWARSPERCSRRSRIRPWSLCSPPTPRAQSLRRSLLHKHTK